MKYYTEKLELIKKDDKQFEAYKSEDSVVVIAGPGERVIIVMGAICVIKSRVSETLNKYISCTA